MKARLFAPRLLFLVLTVGGASLVPVQRQTPPADTLAAPTPDKPVRKFPIVRNESFNLGEKVTYRLRYGWLNAGEAVFSVSSQLASINGRSCYYFKGSGRSMGLVETFFTVRDEFDTWVDAETMLPQRYIRKVHEGKTRFTDEVYFNHEAGTIRGGKGEFNTIGHTRDILSAFYYARTLDFGTIPAGQFVEVPIFLDDKVYRLGFKVIGREDVEVSAGTFRCLKITPRVVAGTVFKDEDNMVIWVTDDANHLPVKIYTPLVVGNINAEIRDMQNLRHPLTSRIDD